MKINPINPKINASSAAELLLSTTQEILINQGYQLSTNPLGLTLPLMCTAVLDTFNVVVSPEPKGFSLIQKSTSELSIDNPSIIDPDIAFMKPGLSDASEIGMTFDTDDPLFEQDAQLTYAQEQVFLRDSSFLGAPLNLYLVAQKMCATQTSVSTPDNKYMKNKENHTRANISIRGRSVR
tara:strand:- start:82 stop:621 length:540 start_codon:yes stop_codon:yes gene_type:complete